MSVTVDGVVLAAGLSTRMRRPKPLLDVGAETFLSRAVQTLREAGCGRIWVVVNAGATWADEAAHRHDVNVVVNERPESEQVDSLRLVVERLPAETRGVLVLPVDVPLTTTETARRIVDAFVSEPAPLYLPFHNGVAGHPVLIGRELFDELLVRPLNEGVRTLIMAHAREVREVAVDDAGILIDIDTPEDYLRHIEGR
jgi:molybdenum cofactor cytidylyltransferase